MVLVVVVVVLVADGVVVDGVVGDCLDNDVAPIHHGVPWDSRS